jgi:hypothetical protein
VQSIIFNLAGLIATVTSRAVKPLPSVRGYKALKRSLLLLEVLLNDAQPCPAATGSEVTWRPQDILPIAFLEVGSFNSKQPTGNLRLLTRLDTERFGG